MNSPGPAFPSARDLPIQLAAGLWGFAEATLFFIVPDVLLSFVACRDLRAGCKVVAFALAGALLGGALMYSLAEAQPQRTRSWLNRVPGINADLITRVERAVADHDLTAVLLGPAMGIPYKIYATEWGASSRGLLRFLLISIPARCSRFLLTVVISSVIARILSPWTRRRRRVEFTILAVFWLVFYAAYFAKFGW
jgi:membrane protein DedA with SNARE-associated domain